MTFAKIFFGVCNEFGAAAGRAKIVVLAAIVGAVFGRVRIDRHAADRVDRAACRRVLMMVMAFRHACTLPTIPPGGI